MTARKTPVDLETGEDIVNEGNVDKNVAPYRVAHVTQERDVADFNVFSSLVNLIDVVVKRGAVNGDEMLSTGILRENLVNRIKELEQQSYGD